MWLDFYFEEIERLVSVAMILSALKILLLLLRFWMNNIFVWVTHAGAVFVGCSSIEYWMHWWRWLCRSNWNRGKYDTSKLALSIALDVKTGNMHVLNSSFSVAMFSFSLLSSVACSRKVGGDTIIDGERIIDVFYLTSIRYSFYVILQSFMTCGLSVK